MIYASEDRMHGTRYDYHRASRLARFGRWLSGDWWRLESKDGVWGVWHPWLWHKWENYRFTKADAKKEQRRRNSGEHYKICKDCGCTYASHVIGRIGGIECP